uniref:Protein kinase domain-containing protein n=1 Tax=Steinernema glaseri TaxID=37863 RepID=A0A1I8A053_9BILA
MGQPWDEISTGPAHVENTASLERKVERSEAQTSSKVAVLRGHSLNESPGASGDAERPSSTRAPRSTTLQIHNSRGIKGTQRGQPQTKPFGRRLACILEELVGASGILGHRHITRLLQHSKEDSTLVIMKKALGK